MPMYLSWQPGMLLCILTGGNIDLSVGSVVCFVGAIGAMLMVNMKMNMWLAILVMFAVGTLIGAFQGFWIAICQDPCLYCNTGRHACLPW